MVYLNEKLCLLALFKINTFQWFMRLIAPTNGGGYIYHYIYLLVVPPSLNINGISIFLYNQFHFLVPCFILSTRNFFPYFSFLTWTWGSWELLFLFYCWLSFIEKIVYGQVKDLKTCVSQPNHLKTRKSLFHRIPLIY